ncbi:MAG: BREX-1 system adenine-specific DNA-methyltransferase PglX [Desulfobacteria bacterium]
MSFDKDTRNLLAKTVTACRRRLIEDVTDQLRGVFGLHPDGTVLPLDKLTHLSPDQTSAARRLRDLFDHYTVGAAGKVSDRRKAAYERMTLEVSFTVLNRLAALRLCEERGLVVECVRKGTTSAGFQMFERISGGALGGRYDTYRVFLECLFDELALDLGVLFDRMTPQSAVFPSERCMEDVLAELNKAELTNFWIEDETIGWVYQYFNPPEERKAMRENSQAPRNSRELAVRNQFFTPRYVVEFLTDNTLGRIWYEMRKGATALKKECRYLVRRPNEVFLLRGEKAPVEPENKMDLSQEELLKQPVYLEYRAKKDPRDLRVLDPACGSGHFLLYAFDLFEQIYWEAWTDPENPKSEKTGRTLHEDFETSDALRMAAPKLILEHNLHGIDIDPRAVQIAALALWLRAQKTWKNLGIKAAERPRIARSNIVTAEPMPGEEDMRREFTSRIKPRVLGQLVDMVFEKMKLAGEAGSLLKIEEEIKDAVAEARKQWMEGPKPERQLLFPGMADPQPKQQELRFDVKEITNERFWRQAEDRILDALKEYAERAENGHATRRRLFAEDAARGFAFIDLCRKRYDVALMNPPFGLGPRVNFEWMKSTYPRGYVDIYAAFLLRGLGCVNGAVGAITSRSWLITKKLQALRKETLLPRIHSLLDLGWPVMDDATVHSCALVIDTSQRASRTIPVFDRRLQEKKEETLSELVRFRSLDTVYLADRYEMQEIPQGKMLYQLPFSFLSLLRTHRRFAENIATARQGMKTFDDFRFIRLRTECRPHHIGTGKVWEPLTKGGPYAVFYSDLPLVVGWQNGGSQLCEVNRRVNGQTAQARQASEHYHKYGGTYSRRCKDFGVRVLPAGFVIGEKGPAILPNHQASPFLAIGLLNSRVLNILVNIQANAKQYDTGIVDRLPSPSLSQQDTKTIESRCRKAIESLRKASALEESETLFMSMLCGTSITKISLLTSELRNIARKVLTQSLEEINQVVDRVCGVDSLSLLQTLNKDNGTDLDEEEYENDEIEPDGPNNEYRPLQDAVLLRTTAEDAISYSLGAVFGRWDVRIALNPLLAPKLPGPFDPLPVCPPGMLIGPDSLPAVPNCIVSEEWLLARPDANTLPPDCSVKNATILDEDYPLCVSWDGILVDDPGFSGNQPHRDDIIRRVREVFDLLWKDKAHEIEQEACDILGVSDLREYFRRPAGYFQDHLKRYSKSRRKAPIYWPLSTASGSYTIWLYYQRLTDQTLYAVINKYVDPKITEVKRGLAGIENDLKAASGSDATRLTDRLGEARTFLDELRDLREELLRIAALPFKPDLNDGVIINAAPFHKLFHLRPWAKDAEGCWKKLQEGDYDWAHLVYTIWPDRVREVCRMDRSIAIAHGLEDLCEVKAANARIK